MWNEGDTEFERHEWRHGFVFAPPEGMLHQHFNTGPEPARYLAISMGSHRYPVLTHKVKLKQAPDASVQEGGAQINYEDQDPRIHAIWLRELAKTVNELSALIRGQINSIASGPAWCAPNS